MDITEKSPIVGIDLGTTNSVVAAVINGKAQVLSEDGESILPSVVGMTLEGKLITGVVARNQQVALPDRTIVSVKRRMGTMDKLSLGDQTYSPPEISAMILRRLRDRATRALGTSVTRAVITVPAFFDENQRQATREAGELAGFSVERIINEPTAATIVYHAGTNDRKHIVVYDFGGGTFDVSIVRMEEGVVEVLSSKGDTKLGGDDLDAILVKFIADQFYEEHEIDLRQNASTRWRLLQACERAKCQLSNVESVQIAEEFIAEKDGNPVHLDYTVTRSEYEELIAGLIDRTIECVDEALNDANLNVKQIDDLVLVGGSTRAPIVQERLRAEFKLEPSRAVDPDLAVALGAATQAAMLDGESVGPVLVDITGHTLGIEAMTGFGFTGPTLEFSPIIRRNSPLPAVHEESYSKVHEDQTSALIHVLQGEHADIHRNTSIGKFSLDLDEGGGDRNKIVVRFDLTLDGILKVTAKQVATGKKQELTIDNALSQFRAEQRDKAEARLGSLFDASDELVDDADLPNSGQWTLLNPSPSSAAARENGKVVSGPGTSAASLVDRAREIGPTVDGEDGAEIIEIAEKLEKAIADGNESAISELTEELEDILFYVQ